MSCTRGSVGRLERVAWGFVLVACGACSTVPMPEAPRPIPPPDVRVDVAEVPPEALVIPPPSVDEPYDPILHSPYRSFAPLEREIQRWATFWAIERPEWFTAYLSRMSRYEYLIDAAVQEHGVPKSLRYLPIVESGYVTDAVSSAAAVGLWQLWGPTAREAGMQVDRLVDERRDPALATRVALAFLSELHDRFDSWFLALAAYNGGPNRVARLLDEHAGNHALSDSLYFVIQPYLPRETREYVPKFLAAAALASNPRRFGIPEPEAREPLLFDEVVVPDATSLDVVAAAAGVIEDEITSLNPHVLRGVTPRGSPTVLRVPPGTGGRFATEYALIPEDERVTVTEHIVVSGDTMWDIARRYGISVDTLREANPSVRPERIRPGDRLLVPLVPGGL